MCQTGDCYYSFNLYVHKESISVDGTCAKYKHVYWVKPITTSFKRKKIIKQIFLCVCVSLFYPKLVYKSVNETLRLTKMQEEVVAQKHIWEKNI